MNWLRRLAAEDTSGIGLGLFRIAYSMVLLGELLQLLYFHDLIFDPVPGIVRSEANLTLLVGGWILVVGCLLVGFKTRETAILNYVLTLGFFSVTHEFEYHVDYAITGLNFLLMFIPRATPFSVDRVLLRRNSSAWSEFEAIRPKYPVLYNYLLVFTGVGIVYFDSLFHKLASSMWLGGLGLWLPASYPNVTWTDLSPLLDQKWLVVFLGYLTLFFEAVFLFLFPFRRFQPALVILGLGLHLGIVVAFPIPFFGLAVVGLYLLLVPESWWSALRIPQAGLPPAGEPTSNVRRMARLAGMYLCIAVVLQGVCILRSPLAGRAFAGIGAEDQWKSIQRVIVPAIAWSRPILGIVPHGVFMDSHFAGYNHVIAVAYEDRKGNETWLPLIRKDSHPGAYVTGRLWVHYTFRVNAPTIDQNKLEAGLRNYTAFWAAKNGIPLRNARFAVYVKKIDDATGWQRGFLRTQEQKPWMKVGEIVWKRSECTVDLPEIESL